MNNREIAIVVRNDNKSVNMIHAIDAIKNAGFKNVFVQWYNEDFYPTQEEQLKYIYEKGLNVIFAHLGYQNINDLWTVGEDGDKVVHRYKKDIKDCKEHGISMVVMHLTCKWECPQHNEIGVKRLQQIVDYAENLNVKVAFENTKLKGYLEYVIKNIHNENVGICFDAGHYHVHFKDEFDFSFYKNKIFAVHLHDNDQNSDAHFLPFDGTLNWEILINNLKKCHYRGPITMEPSYQYKYFNMVNETFYKKAYEIGEKLKEMFDR